MTTPTPVPVPAGVPAATRSVEPASAARPATAADLRLAHMTPAQKAGQARLAAQTPVIVVAVGGPYDLMPFPAAPTYLASYGANPPLLEALAAVLRGRMKPGGRLPVELPGQYPIGAGLADPVE